jgi:Leucine-rich repeat (LRR) protein
MKRKSLILILVAFISSTLLSQNVEIPDTAFLYALIDHGVDINEDSLISFTEAESVTNLDLEPIGIGHIITYMTGIKAFINLERLNCSGNQLTSLNISNNSSLRVLWCGENQLEILDLSNLPNLERLWCNNNQITELILLNDTNLCGLDCSNNLLTSLDLSTNPKLCSCLYGDAPSTLCDLSGMPSLNEVCV